MFEVWDWHWLVEWESFWWWNESLEKVILISRTRLAFIFLPKPMVLIFSDFAPKEIFGNIWKHFCFWHLWGQGRGRCYWHSVGKGHELLNILQCPKWEAPRAKNVINAEVEKLFQEWTNLLTSHSFFPLWYKYVSDGFLLFKIIKVAYNCQKQLRELFSTVILEGFGNVKIPGREFQKERERKREGLPW